MRQLIVRLLTRLGFIATSAQEAYFSAADERLDRIELIHRIARAYQLIDEPPRARRVRNAILDIELRGEQPSPARILRELGQPVRNGGDLNGRDLKVYQDVMPQLGYTLVRQGHNNRWRRVS
jgi:hypothetical protein